MLPAAGAAPGVASATPAVVIALDANGPVPGAWSCLGSNPSCARHDPWWQESLLQPPGAPGTAVQFTPLGPGFSADARLAEAVLWLWRWPDGRALLRTAAAHGVTARFTNLPVTANGRTAVGRYDPRDRSIAVDESF